jgi:hypothetical protein
MRKNSLYSLLAALFLIKAVLFCLILRPWLGPDEAIRFEYARLFSLSGFRSLTPKTSKPNQSEVLRSLTLFNAWEFMDLATPDEAGHRSFQDSPFNKDSASTTYPPLYYLLLGNFWRAAGIQGVLAQLYSGRLISVLLAVLQIVLLVHLARRAWPHADSEVRLCALVFMAFLPQWAYISASVHSDNWSNLLGSLLLLLFLKLIEGPRQGAGADAASAHRLRFYAAHRLRFYAVHGVTLAVILVLMAISTRATLIMMVILGLAAASFILRGTRHILIMYPRARWVLASAVAAVGILTWWFFSQTHGMPEELQEVVGRGLMQRGASIPTEEVGTLLTRMGEVTPGNVLRSLVVLFTTFWLALGTLVYKLSSGWLVALGLVSAACVWGWLKRPNLLSVIRSDPMWRLFWIAPATTVAAVFYLYGPHQLLAPEGRYLLLVLPAIAVIATEGWRRCFSSEWRSAALAAWICVWVFLDGIVLFQYVIPLYYLHQS